ncbi:MAG: hypothetical protein KA138_14780 [Saprospiraceae bacterium]|nr:hypothetical protein [Saprospiraceae bacterium]
MLKLEDLIFLIRNLTTAEKHHFTRNTPLDARYRKLYDMLSQHATEDEHQKTLITNKARRAMKTNGALSTAQNFLGKALLRSLRIQKGDTDNRDLSKEDLIKALIQESKLLLQHGIFDTAISRCKEAIELGTSYEYPALVCEALRHLIYLSGQQDSKQYRLEMEQYLKQLDYFSQLQKNEYDYFILQYRALLLFRRSRSAHSPEVQTEVSELLKNPLLKNLPAEATFLSKAHFYNAHAALCAVSGDRKMAKAHHFSALQLWANSHYEIFKTERPRLFIVHLANYLTYCNTLYSFDNFEEYYEQLEAAPTPTFDDQAEAFQNRIFIKQQYHLNKDELEIAADLIGEIETGLAKYQAKVNKSRELTLRYNHIVTLFALEKYQDALNYVKDLSERGKTEHRTDIQFFIKVFRILIHYELNDKADLDTMVKSTKIIFDYNKQLFDYDRIVLANLAKVVKLKLFGLPNEKTADEIRNSFTAFRDSLLEFAQRSPKPIGFTELLLWVKKGASPVPVTFRDMLREEIAINKLLMTQP